MFKKLIETGTLFFNTYPKEVVILITVICKMKYLISSKKYDKGSPKKRKEEGWRKKKELV